MLLTALLLAAALAGDPTLPAKPAKAAPPAPAMTGPGAASYAAGIRAYHQRQFAKAEAEFQKAADAEPSSAAAAWHLAYVVYKRAEPKRPFHAEKQRAAELFAKAFALDPQYKPTW